MIAVRIHRVKLYRPAAGWWMLVKAGIRLDVRAGIMPLASDRGVIVSEQGKCEAVRSKVNGPVAPVRVVADVAIYRR